jgi:hypothetical protein
VNPLESLPPSYDQQPQETGANFSPDQMDEIESNGTHPVAIYLRKLMLEKQRARKEAALQRRQEIEEMNESMF